MKKQTNKLTNTPSVTPSVVSTPTPAPVAAGGFTLGLVLDDSIKPGVSTDKKNSRQ